MITFFSNFINEHQIPFCNAMYEKTKGEFRFVATEPIWQERIDMGFVDVSDSLPYVIKAYEDEQAYEKACELGINSDVVILGDAPNRFIIERLKDNKLTFRYSERFFKRGRWRILDPRVLKARYLNDICYRNKNLHMLCASAYTAKDCRFIHAYPNKTYKWGYFPEVKNYPDIEKIIELKHPASILWVGRLIELKHPEAVIHMAEELKKRNMVFRVDIIGQGELENKLKIMIEKRSLQKVVYLHGFMPPEEVRRHMEKADIYLFTSDQNEGWGAVLNESMNSACVVVACNEIGSVPYLIRDGQNGFIYDRRKKGDLTEKVICLLEDSDLKKKMQIEAYHTLQSTWNADTAAERLLHLIEAIQNNREVEYTSGPCSRD